MLYDVIIIGADAAGLTAGLYAGRKKLNALILTKKVHGQSVYADTIENYPGILSVSGIDLVKNIKKQVEKFGVPIKEDAEVLFVAKEKNIFLIKTKNEDYLSRAVIIATGGRPKPLGVLGEEQFMGKGVSTCSICDAPFYKGKQVAIVGGGNSAFDSAYDLLSYADKIYILQHRDKFTGDETVCEQLKNSGKVEFLTNAETREIKGSKFVEGLVYENLKTNEVKELKVSGIFVNIGQIPNSSFVADFVKLNERKEIVIDPKTNSASVCGIFAAGDVTDVKYKQFVIAAAEGTKALLSAFEYLRKN